jgi:hypothetical protein
MKDAGHVFCDPCWEKLPSKIKVELGTDFSGGFMHAAEALGWE